MEPMMIVTLLALGLVVLLTIQMVSSRKRESAEEKVMRGYFLLGLSGLMAKIAMADGRVTNDEAELANRFFNSMDITTSEKALCIGNFITSRREGLETRDHAKRFLAYANPTACEFLYDLLWRISRADGTVEESEDRLLFEIARYLGLSENVYQRCKRGEKTRYNRSALRAAGVPSSLVALAGE